MAAIFDHRRTLYIAQELYAIPRMVLLCLKPAHGTGRFYHELMGIQLRGQSAAPSLAHVTLPTNWLRNILYVSL